MVKRSRKPKREGIPPTIKEGFGYTYSKNPQEKLMWTIDGGNVSICINNFGCDRMVVGFTTTYAVSAYHHSSCEFESCSCVLDTTLCDKVCQ
jgi:hypothetical protein